MLTSLFIHLFFLPFSMFNGMQTHSSTTINTSPIVKWSVEKTSAMKILGNSNLHDFTCDVLGYDKADTISFVTGTTLSNKSIPLKGSIKIPIEDFNCHNFIITRNFRNTLKAKEYPFLTVRFISLERVPGFINNKDQLKGVVEIELGGVAKRFEIPYKIQKNGQTIMLNGQRNFTYSDFEIIPPVILGGLVKIYNKFNVEFNLKMIQAS